MFVENGDGIAAYLGDVSLFEKDKSLCNGQKREYIGGNVVFAQTDTDNQRAANARDHQTIRIVWAHHRQRIGAHQAAARCLHRVEQIG